MTSESTTASNVSEFSVSEISSSLKRLVEDAFGRVRVRGEISGYRGPHSSGHAYFSLKDDKAKMDAVIWRGAFSKLDFKPEEGLEVIATGKLTTFPGSSKYQIVIDNIEPAGAGALMALLEERRRKLAAEGLFDPARKQLLPFMPRVIGVVTSPTGAVIRDILHRLNDRFPLHVLVWPVRVQGETSAEEVAAAIRGFNALPDNGPIPKPDLLIVARGGGSLEDLWGFNEEVVVRAAAGSYIPLISAVGHETDTTLIDHASDQRAPTPTGAAEMAVPVRADLLAHVAQLSARLSAGVLRLRDRKRDALRAMQRALPQPDQLMALPRQRFDTVHARMGRGLEAGVAAKRARYTSAAGLLSPVRVGARIAQERRALLRYRDSLPNALQRSVSSSRKELGFRARRLSPETIDRAARLGRQALAQSNSRAAIAFERRVGTARAQLDKNARLLATLSYHSVLDRGFALVRTAEGVPVRHSKGLKTGDALTLQFGRDDEIGVAVSGTPTGKPSAARTRAEPRQAPDQTNLFDADD